MHHITNLLIALFTLMIVTTGCSTSKYVPEGEHMLNSVKVQYDKSADDLSDYSLKSYNLQQPNSKWFGLKLPLYVYSLGGQDTTKRLNHFFRKLGEAPVLYDSTTTQKSQRQMEQVLVNAGYLRPDIKIGTRTKKNKLDLTFDIVPGQRYNIRSLSYNISDSIIDSIICLEAPHLRLISADMPLNINTLHQERIRITNKLRSSGYYHFTKEDISYDIDTIKGSTDVDVTMRIGLFMENRKDIPHPHPTYAIRSIEYMPESDGKYHFRPSFYRFNTLIREKKLYNDAAVKQTFSNFQRLSGVSFTNIQFSNTPSPDSLDAKVYISHSKPLSIGYDVEATNSAGDFGAALSVTTSNNNIFKGCEVLSFKLRGAYEAINGLDGYEGNKYLELGAELNLTFPTLYFPFITHDWSVRYRASSEISIQYNLQERPEFGRRVLTGAWRYKWSGLNRYHQHKFDLLEVNYVYMPWISSQFQNQYIEAYGKTNAILQYNYQNLLITKLGYTLTYNSLGSSSQTYGKNAYTMKLNVETSGNALRAATSAINGKRNKEGQYTFCGIAFAQYVRADLDFTKSFRINRNNSLALHSSVGIAVPYGNSDMLPFEKRYFAGGANSVRGWSVRSLGPGSYDGASKAINFLNQSGDIKLYLSMEYRTNLFWKFAGAVFVDAGNIWTIKKYEDQPGGEFRFDKFFEQIGVAYGLGLRLNMSFFIIRFDAGMKAINPAETGRDHYPILSPKLSRDFALHFAVGMPF